MKDKEVTVFLDRDGIIDRWPGHYITEWNQFKFMPNIFKLLRVFEERNYRVIVVTNQSAVGKGLMTMDDLLGIHMRMRQRINREGGHIEAIYTCTHLKEEDCSCKKPKPGMFIQAKEDFPEIDFDHSFMIGDYYHDMNAASYLGIKTCYLIQELTDLHKCEVEPDFCIADIIQAVDLVPTYFEHKKILQGVN